MDFRVSLSFYYFFYFDNFQSITVTTFFVGTSEAFKANKIEWAAQITAFGEVLTLPVVVLISVVIQPRLQYALGKLIIF